MPKSKQHRSKRQRKLTFKQERFIEEYLIDLNASQAGLRAGYKSESIGRQQLTKTNVQEAIQKARKRLMKRTEVTQDRIITELARLAFMDPRQFFDEHGTLKEIHTLPEEAAAVIAGMDISTDFIGKGDDPTFIITKKIKLTRKEKALEMLCKYLGLFNEKLTLDFSSEVLNAILSGLPDEFAGRVREALGKYLSAKRDS
jgi:phage terminase small subunit